MDLSARDVERLENTSFASAFASTAEAGGAEGATQDGCPTLLYPVYQWASMQGCQTVSFLECYTQQCSGAADDLLDAVRGA